MAHDHSHNHSHAPARFGKAFAISAALNVIFIAVEVSYGVVAHSTALLADAAHNTGDVLGLLLAWGAYGLARRVPTKHFTYGFRSSTILAALFNGMLLLVATGAILWEAIQKIMYPASVEGSVVIAVATVGILINSLSAFLLSRGGDDLNIKNAFWHLVADAAVSAGVVVTGVVILYTNVLWADPLASILISLAIVWSTWSLFRDAVRLSLQAVPAGINIDAVRAYLSATVGVERIHDLHVWPISTTETALTCHFVVQSAFDSSSISRISEELEHRFKIHHVTIQLETSDGRPCRLVSDSVV